MKFKLKRGTEDGQVNLFSDELKQGTLFLRGDGALCIKNGVGYTSLAREGGKLIGGHGDTSVRILKTFETTEIDFSELE